MNTDKWLNKNMQSLSGKTIIVSGANSGIGYLAAHNLAKLGANIIMACRNTEKAAAAKDNLIKAFPSAKVEIFALDLSDSKSIKDFVIAVTSAFAKVDGLVNNAGVYYPSAAETSDGLNMTIGTNFVGTYLLTTRLLNANAFNDDATIDIVTSLTDKNHKPDLTDPFGTKQKIGRNRAYGLSKLYFSAYTYWLACKMQTDGRNIKVISSHPGVTKTNILSPSKTGFTKTFAKAGENFLKLFTHPASTACLTTVYAFSPATQNGDRIAPRGLFEISGRPQKAKYPKRAKKIADALMQQTICQTQQYLQ